MPPTYLARGVAQLLLMSKNNNPQTRPGSVRRRRPKPQAPAPTPRVEVRQSRLRRFLPTVLIPHGLAVLLLVVVSVAALMFSATSMTALPATIAQLWLALNMSAVSGSGEVVGVIPMVPALVLVWTVARRVHRSVRKRVSIADLTVLAVLVLAVPLSLTGIASAMLHDASGVFDVGIPPVPAMLGKVFLLHASALFLGMGPRLWRALARRYGAPEWFVDSITLAIRFLVTYALIACVGVLIMLAVNHQAFRETLSGYTESSAVFALLLLSLLYLPNMVIYAMGVLVGAPLYFGAGDISLFNVTMVPLPPLPLLAALPASASQWAVIGLLIPAIVATWVAIKNPMRLVVTLTSGVFGAFFFLVLSLLAGGRLGVYGYVGLNLLPAVGLIFGYLVLVGALIAGIDRLRSSAKTPPAVPAEYEVENAADPQEESEEELAAESAEEGDEESAVHIEEEETTTEEASAEVTEGAPEAAGAESAVSEESPVLSEAEDGAAGSGAVEATPDVGVTEDTAAAEGDEAAQDTAQDTAQESGTESEEDTGEGKKDSEATVGETNDGSKGNGR